MIQIQSYVNSTAESIAHMKVTELQREFIKAAFRSAIEYANAQHGMHASENANQAAGVK